MKIPSIPIILGMFMYIGQFPLNGQTRGGDLQDLAPYIDRVSIDRYSYVQELNTFGAEKCLCRFELNEENKGKNEVYTFNMADIHTPSVMQATKKDAVFVELATRGKKKLIQTEEDGKITGYTGEIIIFTKDLENAKSLKEILQQRVESCKEIMEEKFSRDRFEDPNSALNYLESNIGDFIINETQYTQQLSHDPQRPWMLTYETTDAKGNNLEFSWNATDIDPSKIDFDTKRENVLINMATRQGKNFIWNRESGELQNYKDKFDIHAPDIEASRIWVNALKALCSGYSESVNSSGRLDNPTLPSILSALSQQIGEVNIEDEGYEQSFYKVPDRTSEVMYEVEDIGKGKSYTYRWNLADLDPGKVEFDTHKKEVRIEMKTRSGEDFIQELEEGIPSGYTAKLSFQAQDIESARLLVDLLRQGINIARKAYLDPFTDAYSNPSYEQALSFCQENIQEVETHKETYRQSISADLEERCLIIFESEEVSKGDEYIFIFHLEDVDPGKLELKTKGDILFLELASKGKKDWIEMTENGEREDFDDQLTIRCQSLEAAKGLKKALSFMTRSCQE